MRTGLAPAHFKKIGEYIVLWFKSSNNYVVVSEELFHLIETYFSSQNLETFTTELLGTYGIAENLASQYFNEITEFLEAQDTISGVNSEYNLPSTPKYTLIKNYKVGESFVKIEYSDEWVHLLIHPPISHLEVENEKKSDVTFGISRSDEKLFLRKDSIKIFSTKIQDFHLLQGHFNFELLSILYSKKEEDWIASFHASTIAKNNEAIMLIGKSGKGKSTLSALLTLNGFDLVSDDFTPFFSENLHVFRNPSALSIKQGAFDIITKNKPDFNDIPTFLNPNKNKEVKYLSLHQDFDKGINHFPCKTIVSVNYQSCSKTELKRLDTASVLNILIPDSWISPTIKHSKLFLDWLESVSCFELTYSNIDEVTPLFDELLKSK